GEAPSQRFRFEQYFGELEKRQISFDVSPFLDTRAFFILYKPGHWFSKLAGITRGLFRRIGDLFSMARYNVVFIHREATPIGPPVFEWIIAKIFRKKIVFDFDDAIWLPNASESNDKLTRLLKRFRNAENISRWATVV